MQLTVANTSPWSYSLYATERELAIIAFMTLLTLALVKYVLGVQREALDARRERAERAQARTERAQARTERAQAQQRRENIAHLEVICEEREKLLHTMVSQRVALELANMPQDETLNASIIRTQREQEMDLLELHAQRQRA